jgi:hypothetical protein
MSGKTSPNEHNEGELLAAFKEGTASQRSKQRNLTMQANLEAAAALRERNYRELSSVVPDDPHGNYAIFLTKGKTDPFAALQEFYPKPNAFIIEKIGRRYNEYDANEKQVLLPIRESITAYNYHKPLSGYSEQNIPLSIRSYPLDTIKAYADEYEKIERETGRSGLGTKKRKLQTKQKTSKKQKKRKSKTAKKQKKRKTAKKYKR